ncbi:hypothetical protein J4219_08465 [Candidatus Woesearchaeota archaeon]|nr:hypothetical protein [Candidatus Woesearchaeota archaeon]
MRSNYRRLKQLFENRLGQELPGWAFVVALIIGLFALIFIIWLAVKSGKTTVGQLGSIR